MSQPESSVSQSQFYAEVAQFWDSHDLASFWDQTQPAEFEMTFQTEVTYFALKSTLAAKLAVIAQEREVSPETLLNAWVRDRIQEEVETL